MQDTRRQPRVHTTATVTVLQGMWLGLERVVERDRTLLGGEAGESCGAVLVASQFCLRAVIIHFAYYIYYHLSMITD